MGLKRALASGVILALAAGCSGGGTLDAKALSDQSESLQSQAAEGALLALDAAAGRFTTIYVRQQSADLYGVASQSQDTLKAATTEAALEPALRKLADLAGRISVDLKRLENAAADEQRAIARDLQTAADASEKVGEALT